MLAAAWYNVALRPPFAVSATRCASRASARRPYGDVSVASLGSSPSSRLSRSSPPESPSGPEDVNAVSDTVPPSPSGSASRFSSSPLWKASQPGSGSHMWRSRYSGASRSGFHRGRYEWRAASFVEPSRANP